MTDFLPTDPESDLGILIDDATQQAKRMRLNERQAVKAHSEMDGILREMKALRDAAEPISADTINRLGAEFARITIEYDDVIASSMRKKPADA